MSEEEKRAEGPEEEEVTQFGIPKRFSKKPGASPGLDLADLRSMPTEAGSVDVTCIDYSPEQSQITQVHDLESFLQDHRPSWSKVRWINVDGLTDLKIIEGLAGKYHLHPLAVEDVLHIPQRPKCEAYDETQRFQARLFLIARLVRLTDHRLSTEQISIFVGHSTVLTFQEDPGDVFDPIRQRITKKGSRVREGDASFLAYSLLDAIVDHCFPLLEQIGDRLEELEALILESPSPDLIQEVHRTKRDLLVLRHAIWPMREVIAQMQREPHECLSDVTRTYLRDLQDHVVQIIDIVEAYREVSTALNDTYMTAMSNRMNEIMKVLTIVGTVFIPITFLAGVYGMNFHHMPELDMKWTYPAFWIICIATSGGLIAWLKSRGWL
ncbi:MAG: magnesium/cobalt transporter CorA [Thermoanaerobaculia bacterium]|nr:Cobalt/magnesium transport protein CorA [Thermoanaerobaculia bacterium]MCK6682614.1 magnesium/cobalt transporter CorA [Thermoanaerobaculia bacterium]